MCVRQVIIVVMVHMVALVILVTIVFVVIMVSSDIIVVIVRIIIVVMPKVVMVIITDKTTRIYMGGGGQTSQRGETGQTDLTFNFDFSGNLCTGQLAMLQCFTLFTLITLPKEAFIFFLGLLLPIL